MTIPGLIGEKEIRDKLGALQPDGFNWVDLTDTEMLKFKAIAQAQFAFTLRKMYEWGNKECEVEKHVKIRHKGLSWGGVPQRCCTLCWREVAKAAKEA